MLGGSAIQEPPRDHPEFIKGDHGPQTLTTTLILVMVVVPGTSLLLNCWSHWPGSSRSCKKSTVCLAPIFLL